MPVAGTTLDSWKEAGVAADFRRDGARSSLVWGVLRDVVSVRVMETGRQALDIVDVGGGTGGLAVQFAALGHNVTVVDPIWRKSTPGPAADPPVALPATVYISPAVIDCPHCVEDRRSTVVITCPTRD